MGNYRDPDNPIWQRDLASARNDLAREEADIRGLTPPEWGLSRRETAGYLHAHGVTPRAVDQAAQRDTGRARHPLIGMFLYSKDDKDIGEIVDVVDIGSGVFLVREYGDPNHTTLARIVVRTVAPGYFTRTPRDRAMVHARQEYERDKALEEKYPDLFRLGTGNDTAESRYRENMNYILREHAREAVSSVVARGGLPYIEAQIEPPEPRIRHDYDNHRGTRTGVPTAVFDGYDGWSGRTNSRGRRVP